MRGRSSCRTRLAATVLVALASGVLGGCPSNLCLLKICKGTDCRCSWSTCPSGSSFDTKQNACVCEQGRVSLGGSCLTWAQANAYCGPASHFEPRGCVRNTCPPGQELNEDSGQCMAKQQVDQVATNMGVPIGQNQKLGCPPGLVLVVEGPQGAACVPPQATCTRDEVWNGQACVKTARCPPGSIFDPGKAICIAYANPEEKEYTVDLSQWVQASYGADGGPGTQAFCSAFSKKPLSFGVLAGGSIRVKITVAVRAPGKQIPQSQVATAAIVEASNAPVLPKGAAEVQKAAQDILGSLVTQGGKSNQEEAVTHVSCLIINAAPPTAVPATGGA